MVDIRRLDLESGELEEAERRHHARRVDVLTAVRRDDQPLEPVNAAEGDLAEGEPADPHRALTTDRGAEVLDGELAQSVDREVGDGEPAERQMVDAHRFDVEARDADAADRPGAEHVGKMLLRQAVHPRFRHGRVDHDGIEKFGEAGWRLADLEIFGRDAVDGDLGAGHVDRDVVVGGEPHAVTPDHVAHPAHIGVGVIDADESRKIGVVALETADRHLDQPILGGRIHMDRPGPHLIKLAVGEAVEADVVVGDVIHDALDGLGDEHRSGPGAGEARFERLAIHSGDRGKRLAGIENEALHHRHGEVLHPHIVDRDGDEAGIHHAAVGGDRARLHGAVGRRLVARHGDRFDRDLGAGAFGSRREAGQRRRIGRRVVGEVAEACLPFGRRIEVRHHLAKGSFDGLLCQRGLRQEQDEAGCCEPGTCLHGVPPGGSCGFPLLMKARLPPAGAGPSVSGSR